VRERQQNCSQLSALTGRERGVLMTVAAACRTREIAASLFVSETAVKSHAGRIVSDLGLRHRVQVVVLAYGTGLIQPGVR
jgi:ATP/maltotriose-dependent transcriptional regulator MalT